MSSDRAAGSKCWPRLARPRRARDDPQADGCRRRCLPHQHEPRRPKQGAADREDPRAGEGVRPPADSPVRPSGAEAPRRPFHRWTVGWRRASASSLDRDEKPGDETRVQLPHEELFAAIRPGAQLLIDDGKFVLRCVEVARGADRQRGRGWRAGVGQQGRQRARRGRADPGADRQGPRRPQFALEQRTDWIALSFVQRPEDVAEARSLIGGRASLLAKIEKPAAIDRLDDIIALADAVMVARGDLGVELPPEQVPPLQNRSSPPRAGTASQWSSRRRCSNR